MHQSDPKTGPDAELAALSRELEAALNAPSAAGTADHRATPQGELGGLDRDRKAVGVLTMAMGGLVLLGARGLLSVLAEWFGVGEAGDLAWSLVWTGALLAASAMVVTGWSVMAGRPWARVPLWLIAAASLFLVPVGTAYGVYAIWMLLKWEKSL